ncbi:Eukaryotic-type DNA primase, large subunit family protein [Trichomonas vaginalis G3]|uniref:Eukaryotic-type DNA primase, large subunit family protein n=1 Tax=Trichomonas vaginalis (strain ATCC PRA-98 / G3) TaxID=412133 RepID=A2FNT1_TRIV3|nr:DNA primase protein [Trichomonas vaginalis G3]EAX93444.1 Eukaryotic-type DNA primase, large subunit family protein [Trichomonas vaginalis G3]KAI5521032.1 DNA primase protein [Trichomonas vaginalis G3]|eukprot:XP_001306374.1 Eukaryotic-type DNA primase, large subunit family protein [Trichomonas vaginalis G3]
MKRRFLFQHKEIEETASLYAPTYETIPSMQLSFEEILSIAEKRFQFHRLLEFEESQETVEFSKIRSLSLEYDIPLKEASETDGEQTKDQISFFSLLMIYTETEEQQTKLADYESRLFFYRLKLSYSSPKQIPDFFWPSKELKDQIINSQKDDYYCVPFEQIFDQIDVRTIDVENGIAKLTTDHVYQIVQKNFNDFLVKKLHSAEFSNLDFISYLRSEFKRVTKSEDDQILTLDNYEELCHRSAPPCIYRILDSLKKSSQLSVKGRFELCMFLKGLGFDYFSQYIFWKKHFFSPKNPDLFDKQIVPSLKYIYCIDGNKKKYQPHSCIALIGQDNPENPYQVQGCPFRYMMRAELKMYIKKMGRKIKNEVISKICEQVPEHPQIACKLFFDGMFEEDPLDYAGMSHPIQFFKEAETRKSDHYY